MQKSSKWSRLSIADNIRLQLELPTMESGWLSLLSGGKDSMYALYDTQQQGKSIVHAMTAQPIGDSYLFHTPATAIASLQAESLGIAHSTFVVEQAATDYDHDSTKVGDQELETLHRAIESLLETTNANIEGIVVGAVESSFQRDRIAHLCDVFELELAAPLWHCSPIEMLEEMVAHGFDIRIVSVAAGGLDEKLLGKQFDQSLINQLANLNETAGIHPMGEGGEYETLVMNGPNFNRALDIEATRHWDGTRGTLQVSAAHLADEPALTIRNAEDATVA